ncbi:MAG TPA: RidA family protein [Puia sp.]|nr:RidA family protein [Puia sp.]
MSAEKKITELGLTLPPPPPRGGIYKPVLIDGKHCYVSGHGPYLANGKSITGKVGIDLDEAQAKQAAQQVGLAILATLKHELGSLDKIKRVIKTLGMVNAIPEFEKHPFVINGCSELFANIWGEENGIGVRSAVGMGSLPGNIAVEIEVLFELH